MNVEIYSKAFHEENWDDFVKISRNYYNSTNNSMKKTLDDLNISEDMIEVLLYRLNDYARDWLLSEVPILDNCKPIELLKTKEGTRAVKEALLRMPD